MFGRDKWENGRKLIGATHSRVGEEKSGEGKEKEKKDWQFEIHPGIDQYWMWIVSIAP